MALNRIIKVQLFGQEIGKIGFDESRNLSSFQFNPEYLQSESLQNIFPKTGIIRRTPHIQLFKNYGGETFRGIPPQFADSLPDMFGSIIIKTYLEEKGKNEVSVLEQLAYVGQRGMGALEYVPSVEIPTDATIDLAEIIDVLKEVLDLKKSSTQKNLDSQSLLNIFKIGTSAGGARPKILISESKATGNLIPGDLEFSDDYNHYIIKLSLDENNDYPREVVEYCYYQIATSIGIRMMSSKLIDDIHFATLRFDRQDGEKKHVLSACGITGWDYKSTEHSSYENLFNLCSFLKIPHAQMEELFKRMVFNVVFGNTDDHLKNHSFIYDRNTERWELSPAYDLTYALNPLVNFTSTKRALSINGKRSEINLNDILGIADKYTIKNPTGIIKNVLATKEDLSVLFADHNVPKLISERILETIVPLK